jgi:transcriptional regulator with XRE-family HTH domain
MEQQTKQTGTTHYSGSRRCASACASQNPLHRIAEVMEQEGISPRGLARRLGTTRSSITKAMDPTNDMKLSELYQLQAALQVPATELLAASYEGLPPEILQRTRLLRMMRTVRSIQEISTDERIQTLAMQLVEKLTEMMPELKEVSAWPSKGKPRKMHELGAIACNVVSLDLLHAASEQME